MPSSLELLLETMLYWKSRIDQILPKLIAACCGVLKAFIIQETSAIVYRGYFHLITNCGNIFWDILHTV